jgi:UrcA family protein
MMTKPLFLAVASALALSPIPALADDLPTRTVHYADLDLTRPEGVARLERRIAAAARSVCPTDDPRDLGLAMKIQKCRKAARASAYDQTKLAIADARSSQRVAATHSASPALR